MNFTYYIFVAFLGLKAHHFHIPLNFTRLTVLIFESEKLVLYGLVPTHVSLILILLCQDIPI